MDIVMLSCALIVAAYLAHKRRSRFGLVWLAVFCLIYFGFYRKGCVCSVGSIQNIALGFLDPMYMVSWPVLVFFALPLAFTLLFGRVFCASVCPLGAVQELVLVKPVRVPGWLDSCLSLIPYAYLIAVLVVVSINGSFLVCRYDPFVSLFRLSGPRYLVVLAVLFVGMSLFVGRPYCRFICPYAVLLRICSRWSWRHVDVAPSECVVCSLCHDACPFDAIRPSRPGPRSNPRTWMVGLFLLLPVLGFGLGQWAGPLFARQDLLVRTAERVWMEESFSLKETTPESEAFRLGGMDPLFLYRAASEREKRFQSGVAWGMALWAMVAGWKLMTAARSRPRERYEADRKECFSCARCFMSCPLERKRRL